MKTSIKICHLTCGHISLDARIFRKECLSLSKIGYRVYLIGPDGIRDKIGGVDIQSIFISYKNRFVRMTVAPYLIYRKAIAINAEIYHFHDALLIPYGVLLKKKGKKVIYDCHEDYPADISAKKWIPKAFRKTIVAIYRRIENYGIKIFDATITVTPHIVDRIKKINKNVYMITNYPIIKFEKNDIFIKKESKVCYVGRISDDELQRNVIKAFGKVENAKYLLAGPCEKKYLSILKKLPEWNKVDYIGEIEFSKSREIFKKSLAGIQIMDYVPGCGNKIGTLGNNKFFGYMEAGVPIICTDFTLWKDIIEKYKCGICVNPHSIDEISNAINYIVNNPEIARTMGINGRDAILREYNWKTQEKILFECYKNVLQKCV